MVEQKLRATLITGGTIEQGVGKELGKALSNTAILAVCFFDKSDMQKIGIKNGSAVEVTFPKYGSVIVKAKRYPWGTNPGMVFIPCGSWANCITGDETFNMGIPLFKGFPVEVE